MNERMVGTATAPAMISTAITTTISNSE